MQTPLHSILLELKAPSEGAFGCLDMRLVALTLSKHHLPCFQNSWADTNDRLLAEYGIDRTADGA